jgi:hypothetical protein
VVVAITRRTDELDAFLAQADRLYLATASDDAYTHLALESLATLGPQTALLRPPTGILARRAAAFGLTELRAATSAREEAPA